MESTEKELLNAVVTPYNLTDEQEKKEIVRHYRALLRTLRTKIKKGDRELLRTAFEMAAEAHKTMRRKSGEPYILHPIAVAMIAADEIGLGVRSTICALLHDTVEDTDITLDDNTGSAYIIFAENNSVTIAGTIDGAANGEGTLQITGTLKTFSNNIGSIEKSESNKTENISVNNDTVGSRNKNDTISNALKDTIIKDSL